MKIVIDDKIPYIKKVFEPFAEVLYKLASKICNNDIIDADVIIIRTRTKCNEELLKNSSVKLIVTATIGYDHLDLDYLQQKGIKWVNCPGCNSYSVQQYIASCLVTLAEKYNHQLEQMTLGIIGCGYVGEKIKMLGEWLGMRILVNDPPREQEESGNGFVDLDKVLNEADIITIHTPLFCEGKNITYHLVDESFFNKMKNNAFIINSARGDLVDNQVLKIALQQKIIGGAILDVWENEPNIDNDLVELLDIATAHIAGYAVDGKATGTEMAVREVANFFKLPLDNWLPSGLPKVQLNFENLSLSEKILLTYKVSEDDALLRRDIKNFEFLRHNYRIRRDFSYFKSIVPHILL